VYLEHHNFGSNDAKLSWPILNIIQRSSVLVYQQVFTFLLQTYRAKYILQRINLRSLENRMSSTSRKLSKKLRHRLIWFADTIRFYLTENVIAPFMAHSSSDMAEADDIDEMSAVHIKHLARLQDHALLSESLRPIHSTMISVLDLAVSFAEVHAKQANDSHGTKITQGRTTRTKRKSVLPALVEDESSGADSADEGMAESQTAFTLIEANPTTSLEKMDEQFGTLLSFGIAGLKSVGRVAAEPVWEMLADRLEWNKGRDRVFTGI
jgi:gamma-tubulin complex component 5